MDHTYESLRTKYKELGVYSEPGVRSRIQTLRLAESGRAVALTSLLGLDPVLTVTLANKWYELILLTQYTVTHAFSIHFGHLEDVCPPNVSPYLDHAPNPIVVRILAARNGFYLDCLADELITGRWQLEYVEDRYMQCDRCEGAGIVPLSELDGVMPDTCRRCKGLGFTKPEPKAPTTGVVTADQIYDSPGLRLDAHYHLKKENS